MAIICVYVIIPHFSEPDLQFSTMTAEQFAGILGKQMKEVDERFEDIFFNAIIKESIRPQVFIDMSKEDCKKVFSLYLENYGFGISKEIEKIQMNVREVLRNTPTLIESSNVKLREFDQPQLQLTPYKKGIVRPNIGNVLVPVHEFIVPRYLSAYAVAKEVVRFTAACMNARKNGTLHIGIEGVGNGCGKLVGVHMGSLSASQLDEYIASRVKQCFRSDADMALQCIRSIKPINVENTDLAILEVDVIASSFCCPPGIFAVQFPPNGPSEERYFVYDLTQRCSIVEVDSEKINDVEKRYLARFKEREQVEKTICFDTSKTESHQLNLLNSLTGQGIKYVTDEFVPLIISGRISGCRNQTELRDQLQMQHAFLSAKCVIDMEPSSRLRSDIEGDKRVFTVKTADDIGEETGLSDLYAGPLWLYANGFEDKNNKAMVISEWNSLRYQFIDRILTLARQNIPPGRAKVVLLIYQEIDKCDPLYELSRDMMLKKFPGECVVVSDNPQNVQALKEEVLRMTRHASFESFFHTELEWPSISEVLCSVFRQNPDVVCRLPASGGHFVDMTAKERMSLDLKDIEILSGEECVKEAEAMNDDEREKRAAEVEESFYRGTGVTWWNFYFRNQVGKRDAFDIHQSEIRKKLNSNYDEALVKIYRIEHHPGAGGSTLGRNLLWHFSQFKCMPESAYRCCTVNKITDDTVDELVRFRNFKDPQNPKPFLVLVDNKSVDDLRLFRLKLNEAAYKTGTPGKLFCLVIQVTRVSITEAKRKGTLKHDLSGLENNWFEKKYKELNENRQIDVKTLIAFNVMRNSFDKAYIDALTSEMMKGITTSEYDALKCLSLVSSYGIDHQVPKTILDTILEDQVNIEEVTRLPFGIVHSFKELAAMSARKGTWNLSNAMSLFITERNDINFYHSGLSIISQPLAKSILEFIMVKDRCLREELANYVLDVMKDHVNKHDPMSKRFVKIVCSLFKTRQMEESDKPETKSKFSDLVLDLEREDESQSVVHLMKRCFDEAKDAMVGQQLARYLIHINEYNEAEKSIRESLEIMPNNSYLLDTYGQVFKAKSEYIYSSTEKPNDKISLDQAAVIIKHAFEAIDKFKESQEAATKNNDVNMSCFHMEVKTAVSLLENFKKFDLVHDRTELCRFLTDKHFILSRSPFAKLVGVCPDIQQMQIGTEWQMHLEESLRNLEETNYQIRGHLYTVHTDEETLLLKMRERYERFYGGPGTSTKYQFTFGLGIKPLMNATATEKGNTVLNRRVHEASESLLKIEKEGHLKNADVHDLLVYLGKRIIDVSGQSNKYACDNVEYRRLLRYSQQLIEKQRNSKNKKVRRYLESYLYFAMLHWPLEKRVALELDALSKGGTYEILTAEWEDVYDSNHSIASPQQSSQKKPKSFFALGKGSPGNDIVDLDVLNKEWKERKKKEGRHRLPVYGDYFWTEKFVEERLVRLEGIVDGQGRKIIHTVQ